MAAEVQIFSVCKWQMLTVHSTLTSWAVIAQWTMTTRWTARVSFLIAGWSLHLKQVFVAIQCPLQQELWQRLEAITYLSPMPKLKMSAVLKIPFFWDITLCTEPEDWGFRSATQQVTQVTKFYMLVPKFLENCGPLLKMKSASSSNTSTWHHILEDWSLHRTGVWTPNLATQDLSPIFACLHCLFTSIQLHGLVHWHRNVYVSFW